MLFSMRFVKKIAMVIYDYFCSALSVFLVFVLSGYGFKGVYFDSLIHSLIIYPIIIVLLFYIFKVYNVLWRYAPLSDYLRIAFSIFVSNIIFFFSHKVIDDNFELSTFFVILLFSALLTVFPRILLRKHHSVLKNDFIQKNTLSGNIMVIGGGSAGSMLIRDIKTNDQLFNCNVKCIIDDNPEKKGQYVSGICVVGGCEEIVAAAEKFKIDIIVFAIPTCSNDRKSTILKICQKTGCKVRIIPSYYQLLSDDAVNVNTLRDIQIEDLLGREPIKMELDKELNYVCGKVVMVTGGGGSIGSELCRQLARHNPKMLIIFDIYENNAYEIQNQLLRDYPELNLVTLIGSVRDVDRLDNVFDKYRPQIIYHAAAHKHVPLMEDSPNESIKNNVFGTLNTVKAADKYGVEKFILISTDKAVNPTNIMGASKRICEMIVQSFNNKSKTEFVAVRFGNVLGSNGSVIPLFKSQIEHGGPVTVTDPKIIRYFMTIPEAVSLVLKAGASAKGGEIFVLDMGEPVKIIDLAENLIRLSGYEPYTDIKIEFTGLRPGEKLYEEMLMSAEGLKETANSLIFIGHPIDFDDDELMKTLDSMYKAMYDDGCDIRSMVKKIVPTYNYKKLNAGEPVEA